MKLMVQNLFWEHFKLSPKPSSISNMEPFGCHHTGEQEVIVKRLGCHSSAAVVNPIPCFATFLFSRGMGSRRRCNCQVVVNYPPFFLWSAASFWDTLLTPAASSVIDEMKEAAQLLLPLLPYRPKHRWKPLHISKKLTTAPSQVSTQKLLNHEGTSSIINTSH